MPRDTAPQAEHPNANSDAWGKIPEAFVRDLSVTPEELVLTAYRSTFTKSWVLREAQLRQVPPVKAVNGRGMGRDVIRRAIAAMKARGTLERGQPAPAKHVMETLRMTAPAVGFFIVWRWWFSAVLTLKALAAWMFIRVGTQGPVGWARGIRTRFGWDPHTIGKVMGELDEAGLLATTRERGKDGTHRGIGYQAAIWEKPGREKPGRENPGDILKTSCTKDLPHESPLHRREVGEQLALRANRSDGKLADEVCRRFLRRLTTADVTGALASKLRRNARGLGLFLEAMVEANGTTPEQVVEIVEARLLDATVRGKPVESEAEMNVFAGPELYEAGPGWVTSWSYLAGHVADEVERLRWHERATDAADA